MDVIYKIFLIIIACAITGSIIGYAYADDYFPIMGVWDHSPHVCLNINDVLHSAFKAVGDWRKQLRLYTQSTNFDYTLYKGIKPECDIIIHENLNMTGIYGNTICSVNRNVITSCVINIMTTTPSHYRADTFKHEFGHALGLNHRQTDNMWQFPYLVQQDDIMLSQASPFDKITQADLDALLFIYGEDGYQLPNNYNKTYGPKH